MTLVSRAFITPEPGDDLAAVAARVLPEVEDAQDAAQQLLSWNLHLAARIATGRSVGLLPSDIVFIEAPPTQGETA